ncbi:hypothetical protein ADZ36_17585 [Streptomyces fradiae]|uniref:Uncharacterized protein n=3 Tax=Streptomyces TaxID=1883 RepID=A0A3M8FB61_9ACTN|nr:hypothetical protein ADZ36_17585 [Streptomyces fradiae]OFA46748.1 hypothetical protein BEN35_20930 [Streptomyces fradiae]PQM22318.1 hypothetical protein Sfr7A_15215 [Streptomyces xinghaiensis]RKM96714.1 hypothetical protein SFRA_011895 [Streptomyces xinghaiensis]RNC74134.1 hypothetical protein DC095_010250 [Streptomyces xinghaiensis]
MGQAPGNSPETREWIDRFQQEAEAGLREQFATEADRGALHALVLENHGDHVRAVASFSMEIRPGVIFMWSRRVVPDLSETWDPGFAAMLFGTHLTEWFHTEAKKEIPGPDGVVRN